MRRILALVVLATAASASVASGPLPVVTRHVLRKQGPHGRWRYAYTYPQIRVPDAPPGARRNSREFNRQMRQQAERSLAAFKRDLALNATLPVTIKARSVRTVTYTLVTHGRGLLAFRFTQFQYLRGQAHPFTQVFTVNFETRSGFVKLADLFAPHSDYLQKIASAVQKDITAQAKKQQFAIIEPGGFAARAANFRDFVISREGLQIFLEPYQVAAGYVGMLTATVPWSALESDLSDRARQIRREDLLTQRAAWTADQELVRT